MKTCLRMVGWSAWIINLSSCWPVLDKVQEPGRMLLLLLLPPNTAEDLPSKPGLVYGFGWKPQANHVKLLDSTPNQAKFMGFCFVSLGDDWQRKGMEENLPRSRNLHVIHSHS